MPSCCCCSSSFLLVHMVEPRGWVSALCPSALLNCLMRENGGD